MGRKALPRKTIETAKRIIRSAERSSALANKGPLKYSLYFLRENELAEICALTCIGLHDQITKAKFEEFRELSKLRPMEELVKFLAKEEKLSVALEKAIKGLG
jgi:hypothetical protein